MTGQKDSSLPESKITISEYNDGEVKSIECGKYINLKFLSSSLSARVFLTSLLTDKCGRYISLIPGWAFELGQCGLYGKTPYFTPGEMGSSPFAAIYFDVF